MPTDHQVTGDGVWFESKDRAKMYADAYGKDLVEAKAVGWRRTLSRWDPAYDLYEGLLRSARSGIEWQRREKEAMDADDEEERRREFAFSCACIWTKPTLMALARNHGVSSSAEGVV